MITEKSKVWAETVHLRPFAQDDEMLDVTITVSGDEIEVENGYRVSGVTYTPERVVKLTNALLVAVNVAKCHNNSYVPF